MASEYFGTHFKDFEHREAVPAAFAIITGFATTGEVWTDEENLDADRRLKAELRDLKVWVERITGFSPETGHAEPGWAVEISFDQACDFGLQFKQDAVFYVENDQLSVSFCDNRRGLVHVGSFRHRLVAS